MRDEYRFTVDFSCNTNGKGLWSSVQKLTHVHTVELHIWTEDEPPEHGEIRAYFNPKEWKHKKDGLIYTDEQWMKEFKKQFKSHFRIKRHVNLLGISYSEQGMQG